MKRFLLLAIAVLTFSYQLFAQDVTVYKSRKTNTLALMMKQGTWGGAYNRRAFTLQGYDQNHNLIVTIPQLRGKHTIYFKNEGVQLRYSWGATEFFFHPQKYKRTIKYKGRVQGKLRLKCAFTLDFLSNRVKGYYESRGIYYRLKGTFKTNGKMVDMRLKEYTNYKHSANVRLTSYNEGGNFSGMITNLDGQQYSVKIRGIK